MDKCKVLLVDDEARIRDLIKEYTIAEGYDIQEAANGEDALVLFRQHNFDLVILDVMMPKIDGWNVCKEIRKTSSLPIIMLTARGEEYDKLFAFELGVDDYLVKPFSPKELLARIKAILRRSVKSSSSVPEDLIQLQGLIVEFYSRDVTVDGELVSLTPKEFELLRFFLQNQHRVFTREQLLNSVWGYDFGGDDRTVDTHIKMLRETLGPYRKFIVTIWGTGYKFEAGK